ncbi:MAG: hypothetical protein N3E36_06570 [Sulfolobales archaeon]|nr:hypothetical protein [Sulfolobales archaeon]MCX8199664.1 hypothetical protein [Sulfolobales archaeon]MDW8170618.1 hypothetical protein [Desulfurococcaceae archaeon]
MSLVNDLLINLRKSIEKLENGIDLGKSVLSEYRALKSTGRISTLAEQLKLALRELNKSMEIYQVVSSELDSLTSFQVSTFISYVRLVSLPYISDILGELIRDLESNGGAKYLNVVRELMNDVSKAIKAVDSVDVITHSTS